MKSKLAAILTLSLLVVASSLQQARAQNQTQKPDAPKQGTHAPALALNHLLQAPEGTRAEWPALRGKVVVLEFWATWCAPCVAEIPVWNALAASVDPAKVQFLSVDDESPALVQAFLKKKPISGWIGLDTTSKVFDRYGVVSRPMTVVIGPDGRVVSTTAHLEQITRERLLAVAKQKPVDFTAKTAKPVDLKAMTERNASLTQTFAPEPTKTADGAPAYEISVTPGDQGDGHITPRGPGQIDMTNIPVKVMLEQYEDIPKSRITVVGTLPETPYNLHVNAPQTDATELKHAVESAIAAGTGVKIEHHAEMVDAYVLTATPAAKDQLDDWKYPGGAMFNPKSETLMCIHATPDQLASGLETALGSPVVNETALPGKLKMVNLKIVPKDLSSAQAALLPLGLALMPAKRQIDTMVLTAPNAAPSK